MSDWRNAVWAAWLGALPGVACSIWDGSESGVDRSVGIDAQPEARPDDDSSAPGEAGVPQATSLADAGDSTGPAARALTDGFESIAPGAPPDPALWTVGAPDCSGSGTLAVDDSQAHGGHRSVRVIGGGGYCDHVFFGNASVIGALGGEVFARFFVRFAAPLGTGHVTFLAMKDDADDGGDVRMGGQDSVLIYNRQSDDATLPVLSPTGVGDSVAPPASTWTCVELHVDEAAGTIDTWVDGQEVTGLVEDGGIAPDVSTQWLARAWKPRLAEFRLGWESYAGQAMTLWFDDVALAPRRIGCGP
jgi:hypothetical protein